MVEEKNNPTEEVKTEKKIEVKREKLQEMLRL